MAMILTLSVIDVDKGKALSWKAMMLRKKSLLGQLEELETMITNIRQPKQKPDRSRIAIDLLIDFLFEINSEEEEGDATRSEPCSGDTTPLSLGEKKPPLQQSG